MQVKTRIKAGGLKTNHNETLGRALVPNQEQGLKGKTMKLTMFRHALEGRSLLLAPLLAGMLLLLLPLGVRADSFTVDLLTDTGSRGYCNRPGITGQCTLREAITASNANGQWNNIYLPKGNYFLTRALPPITSSLIIQGDGPDGPNATVIWGPCDKKLEMNGRDSVGHCDLFEAGKPEFRVFNIAAGVRVGLFEMTIRGGQGSSDVSGPKGGAGILNQGNLELHHVTVMGNIAHNGGGGIETIGGSSLLLGNSTVRDNFSHHGPGGGIVIAPNSTVWIWNSTISGNRVNNSEWSGGNQGSKDAAGGILNANPGVAWLTSVTITANGARTLAESKRTGGVRNRPNAKFFFANTIIASNNILRVSPETNCTGELITLRGNLVEREASPQDGCNIKDWESTPLQRPTDVIGNFFPDEIFVTDNVDPSSASPVLREQRWAHLYPCLV